MQLLLLGPSPASDEGQKIAKMGRQIAQMESRPIPSDVDPSLSRFVPKQLLDVEKSDDVLKFLQTLKERTWLHDNDKADPWIAALESGKPTDLSPNSQVCCGYLKGDE